MTSLFHDDFTEPAKCRRMLASHLNSGRISLIVGSGISSNLKLPNWKDLIRNLYKNAACPISGNFSMDQKAQEFYIKHCNSDKLIFKNAVFGALYPTNINLNTERLLQDKNLVAIAALCASSVRGRVSNIITFNFDNVLEMSLAVLGIVTDSVYRPSQLANNVDVTIYHIHGYLPYGAQLENPYDSDENELILTRNEFLHRISDPSDLWRAQALSIMSRNVAVFVGLSGDDDNLFSLASKVRAVHSMTPYWGVALTTKKDDFDRWQDLGIFAYQLDSYKQVSTFLLEICQEAATCSNKGLNKL